jgi:spore coat protein CotF
MQNNDNNQQEPSWDSMLTDDSEKAEQENYIVPNIELKLPANKRMECRQMIREIKDFGVNQRQVLYLIYLLSLEIERRDTMIALTKTIGEHREHFVDHETPSIIIPQ